MKRIKLFEDFSTEAGMATMYNLEDKDIKHLEELGATVTKDEENSTQQDSMFDISYPNKDTAKKIADWIVDVEAENGVPEEDVKQLYPELFTESAINRFDTFLNEAERVQYYILNSSSKVDTKNPSANEYVEKEPMTYILLQTHKYTSPIILSGSGKPEGYGIKKGAELEICDDGNGTTRFPKGMIFNKHWRQGMLQKDRFVKNWGDNATVIAFASTPEEITENFPPGKYQLFVMK